jgi:serine/threonine protein kinase/tetratricopeptide (TPR) repeat protein
LANKCPKCHSENPESKQFCADCGTQLSPPPDHPPVITETLQTPVRELTTGSTFAGRYQVIEELGHGGMGRVYKVQDTEIKEKVALKLLRPEITLDKEAVERFSNELKLARKISHRNVCRMFDLGRAEGTTFITMEFVPGEDLKSFLHRAKQLSIGTAVSIARQVCEGLEEAHRLGIVHRDLKPGNIMIDKDGDAKVMDFGIARSLSGRGITGAGVLIGTPEYMSPEQVDGKEVDQRSDLYSLGVILYEMVTGRIPFSGDTPLSVAHKQRYEAPEDPKKLNAHVSDDLAGVILKCLAKDRDKRFQSAAELGAELGRIEQGLPTTDRIVSKKKALTSKEFTVKFTPKKLLLPAAALIVIVVLAILLWHPPSHNKGQLVLSGKPSLAVLPFVNYSGDASLENWRDGFPMLLTTGLSASKYLKVLRQDEVNGVLKKLNLTEGKALTSDNIKKIAQEAEVTSLLEASFVKAGPNLIITAVLVNGQTGETQATLSMKPQTIENILGGGLDGLVKEIKQGLNITQEQLASDIDVEIGNVMTRNPEALKYYVEGERLHLATRQAEAIEPLKKAVELDPDFAMAHRLLGVLYGNLGQSAKSKESYEKAFRLKDRMPPREYYILQGDYYKQSEETYPKAIEMYKKVLDIYPDDYLGNHLLAWAYHWSGELNLAIEQYSKILKSRPRDLMIYTNVADEYAELGEYEKATQTMKEFVANNPGNDLGHAWLGSCYIMQRRFDLATQEVDQAITIRPDKTIWSGWKGDISYCKDDLEEAVGFYRTWLDNTKSDREKTRAVWRLNCIDILTGKPEEALTRFKSYQELFEKIDPLTFHYDRGHVYMASQMAELALEEFKKADALVPESGARNKRESYFWEAVAQLEKGDFPEVEKLCGEIDRLLPRFLRNKEENTPYLLGRLTLARKNLPDALKLLDETLANCPRDSIDGSGNNALYLDSLASACLEMGDVDDALKNYEKITLLTTLRFAWGDLYAKSFYSLGKIYEQKGLKGKAAENFEKFISLWKDCEPRFRPLVDDARKRLAGL